MERRVRIATPAGSFEVWTRRAGGPSRLTVLVLHGGPGGSHEYLGCLEGPLLAAGVEVAFHDQLGCGRSDRPGDAALWTLDRFMDEVEQVRRALELPPERLVLLGHSWGGILALEHALRFPGGARAIVVSNMAASFPAYRRYVREVLAPQLDPAVVDELRRLEGRAAFQDPRYLELMGSHFHPRFTLRLAQWPEPVLRSLGALNWDQFAVLAGGHFVEAGALARWDRTADLPRIAVPALVVGATFDSMDPAHLRSMAERLPRGRYLHCPEGSHLCMWDDPEVYARGLVAFLRDLDAAG